MRTIPALSVLSLAACSILALAACASPTGSDLSVAGPALSEQSAAPPGHCAHAPAAIADAFADFDAATTPPALGQPATTVLAAWLDHLAPDVVFEAGNAPPLVGRAAVAAYFAPLLPAIGGVVHDLDTVSPVCGAPHAWSVRGTLLLTRRSDGQAIQPIPFTDTLFFDEHETRIARYEIRFDPTPIGQLFAP